MRVDPRIAVLRGRDASQRNAAGAMFTACEAWRADPRITCVLNEFGEYGHGRVLGACPVLARCLTDHAAAMELAGALVEHLLPALRAEPLGQAPLRHVASDGVSTLLLAREGRARLMLSAREHGDYPCEAVAFGDGERRELVLAGRAQARLVRLEGTGQQYARLAVEEGVLSPGTALALDPSRELLVPVEVEHRLVSLRLVRDAMAPQPTREYRLSDGAFLHQASGGMRESRHELMLALLGRMGRKDAAPVMAEMTRADDPGASEHLRWQALRECLALDTAIGFPALCSIACDAADPLAVPAGALRAQLLETHPVLAELEAG